MATITINRAFVARYFGDCKTVCKLLAILIMSVFVLDDVLSNYAKNKDRQERGDTSTGGMKPKQILLYTSWWGVDDWEVGLGKQPFDRLQCPVKNCEIINDKSQIDDSDAVLFHIHELKGDPPVKREGQKFVFFMLESPAWSQNRRYSTPQWKEIFDWTMTYRLDSDIRLRYGRIWRKKEGRALTQVPPTKTKLVAWIVSNCNTQSKREEYMRELARHIDVDVYGRCGNLTCTKDWVGKDQKCLEMVNEKYLFYIAFENSFCTDYVTEKLFKVLPLDVVPIVRGGAQYEEFTPEQWYINTDNFAQPYQLADYLKYLAENPEEYLQYFEDKEFYNSQGYFGIRDLHAWCELCEKLNDPHEVGKSTEYDMSKWWSKRDCQNPTDLIWK